MSQSSASADERARQALIVWGVFIILAILLNGTLPFALGVDVSEWTKSLAKSLTFHTVFYAGLFLVVPLILTKGWRTIRQPAFLVALSLAVMSIVLRPFFRSSVALVVPVLAYLHWRYDLSDLGFRSRGWQGDAIAILFLALFYSIGVFMRPVTPNLALDQALLAGLDRWFTNPASTTENLFYYGFLTERLAGKFGPWLTSVLIALMYTAHEMTNPEYWYSGMPFGILFVGIAVFAAVYLWRRSVIVIWLGDGLGKAVGRFF